MCHINNQFFPWGILVKMISSAAKTGKVEREFHSRGIIDHGSCAQLTEGSQDFVSEMAKDLPKDNGEILKTVIEVGSGHFNPKDRLAKVGSKLISLVKEIQPKVETLTVYYYLTDMVSAAPKAWHTDFEYTQLSRFRWPRTAYRLGVINRRHWLLAIGRPGTETIDGTMHVAAETITELPIIKVPGYRRDIGVGIDKIFQGFEDRVLLGADGQILRFPQSAETDSSHNYRVTTVPKGNLGEISPFTLHRTPRLVRAGGVLLSFW